MMCQLKINFVQELYFPKFTLAVQKIVEYLFSQLVVLLSGNATARSAEYH
jgi:hypothetical protein